MEACGAQVEAAPMATPRARRAGRTRSTGSLLLCLLALLCAACRTGPGAPPAGIMAPPTPFPVAFEPTISYDEALRELTDLGLQPSTYCSDQAALDADERLTGPHWRPAGQRGAFPQSHSLFVVETPLLAPDWTTRIYTLPGVKRPSPNDTIPCPPRADPSVNGGTPPPLMLTFEQVRAEPYVSAGFSRRVDYDTALQEISDLGLRLADPCYERARTEAQREQRVAPWHPMGQESSFSSSHTLIVAPEQLVSAVTWQDQLRALPDVLTAATVHAAGC